MLKLQENPVQIKRHGRWKKGESGNPGGRKAGAAEFDAPALARRYAPDAIEALVVALRFQSTRVPAAIALLDRGFGKPQVTVHSQADINVLHLVAAQALGAELVQAPETKAIEAVVVQDDG